MESKSKEYGWSKWFSRAVLYLRVHVLSNVANLYLTTSVNDLFYSYQWSWPTRSVPEGRVGWGEAVWWCPSGPSYWGGSRYRWQPRRGLTGPWWRLALGSSPCQDTASHTASSRAETPSAVKHTQYHMLDKPELSCSIEIRQLLPQIIR